MPFSAGISLEHGELSHAVFTAEVVRRGIPFVVADQWTTSVREAGLDGTLLLASTTRWGRSEVVDVGDALVTVILQMGHVMVSVASETEERGQELLEQMRERFPAPDPSGRREVTVTFWTYGPHGPQPSWRTISVPEWSSIRDNYSAPVQAGLDGLMTGFQPAHGGQLVLWHGLSGSGKTFALRALAWEWRDWCEVHYIVDPDSFFGQHADYLMHLLLSGESDGHGWQFAGHIGATHQIVVGAGDEPEQPDASKGWRLLVLEDTGELLQPDAKAVIGQGLSRFLNLVDGLIGQGLRVLVLVTTNEELRKLHPAVARPGRCAAEIPFDRLTAEEADGWLGAHGVDAADGKARSIAELYGILAGAGGDAVSVPFGGEAGAD